MPDGSFPVACAWSLYPLGRTEYMEIIYREIAQTQLSSGLEASPSHYCSRLDGPASAIFAALRNAFEAVRKHVDHTVIHATLSKGSPSKPRTKVDLGNAK